MEDSLHKFVEIVDELDVFVKCGIVTSFSEKEIFDLFQKAKSVDKAINLIKESPILSKLPGLSGDRESICDNILVKFLSQPLPLDVCVAVGQAYVQNCGGPKFEAITQELVNARSVFIQVSKALSPLASELDFECAFIVESWLKLSNPEEISKQVSDVIESRNFDLFCKIVSSHRTEWGPIRNIALNTLSSSSLSNESWLSLIQSLNSIDGAKQLLNLIILQILLNVVDKFVFNVGELTWENKESDVTFDTVVQVVQLFARFPPTSKVTTEFVRKEKTLMCGNIWKAIFKKLNL